SETKNQGSPALRLHVQSSNRPVALRDAVTAGVFGGVELGVGALEERCGSVAWGELGDAEADGQGDRMGAVLSGRLGDGAAHALGELARRVERKTGQDQREFFAADAAQRVTVGDASARAVRDRGECAVACGMTVVVVHALEMVEVEQHETELLCVLPCAA